ncbi:unnamed protein product [Ilex paraguariensis]|uniref:DNA-directed primase/polymerase protein n=1 Tax=Ilex paraguariensis TaxID=185542 RepID=A0ABC8U5A4_9AQUA
MDDVDRLFECFKCGVSPPQSALRVRKTKKDKMKQTSSTQEESPCSDIPSSGSAGEDQHKAIDLQQSMQKLSSPAVKRNNFNNGKRFSPIVFYGSPHGVPPKRPIRLLRLLHEIRVDLTEQNKLREDIWATFPRQDEAMKYAKEHPHARVFSYQDHINGQRRFLVSSYKEFCQRYKNMNPKFRHHYEVIQEGLPCHLYFDLEFSKRENPERNGEEMVDLLLSVIFDALSDKYFIQGNHDWVVELDSSTEEKFSRHLIIRLPKAAFKDNSHAGAFVAENDEEMLMASLICNMDVNCEELLICKMDLDCVKALHFDIEINSDFCKQSDFPQEFILNACTTDASRTYLMGKSPFPALDMFVESVASIGNVPGKIRSWFWLSEYGLMVYSMSRNRYCERIGRQHKSNHVIYVVDLRRAVYYQKCHDPDCRGYRSPLRPIPTDVIPDSTSFFNIVGHNEGDEPITFGSDERITDSCKKDGWWLEAISVAEKVENLQKSLDLTDMDETCDKDDDWWMAVERTASQTELTYFKQI